MIEVDIEYDNGERETLKIEGGELITMARSGRVIEIRIDGVTCDYVARHATEEN